MDGRTAREACVSKFGELGTEPTAVRIFTVDAFTEVPYSGNPAGVCLLDSALPDSLLSAIAAEMNLSETAFVSGGSGRYDLRWFTPTVEVDLCGHATLASAHVLYELGESSPSLEFSTRSGTLFARRDGAEIMLDFPRRDPEVIEVPDGLNDAIGVQPVEFLASGDVFFAVLADEASVRSLQPDISAVEHLAARALLVSAASDRDGVDFVSRYFAPSAGIPEDPVTGSAHCILGPYWSERFGRDELVGEQVSHRGGRVKVRVESLRVELCGRAVTVVSGELAPAAVAIP